MIIYVCLDVFVILTYILIISFNLAPLHVFFSAILHYILAIGALTYPLIKSFYPAMSFLMRRHFLLAP